MGRLQTAAYLAHDVDAAGNSEPLAGRLISLSSVTPRKQRHHEIGRLSQPASLDLADIENFDYVGVGNAGKTLTSLLNNSSAA